MNETCPVCGKLYEDHTMNALYVCIREVYNLSEEPTQDELNRILRTLNKRVSVLEERGKISLFEKNDHQYTEVKSIPRGLAVMILRFTQPIHKEISHAPEENSDTQSNIIDNITKEKTTFVKRPGNKATFREGGKDKPNHKYFDEGKDPGKPEG